MPFLTFPTPKRPKKNATPLVTRFGINCNPYIYKANRTLSEFCRGSSGVEQLIRNQQVVGSNPILGSTIICIPLRGAFRDEPGLTLLLWRTGMGVPGRLDHMQYAPQYKFSAVTSRYPNRQNLRIVRGASVFEFFFSKKWKGRRTCRYVVNPRAACMASIATKTFKARKRHRFSQASLLFNS